MEFKPLEWSVSADGTRFAEPFWNRPAEINAKFGLQLGKNI